MSQCQNIRWKNCFSLYIYVCKPIDLKISITEQGYFAIVKTSFCVKKQRKVILIKVLIVQKLHL